MRCDVTVVCSGTGSQVILLIFGITLKIVNKDQNENGKLEMRGHTRTLGTSALIWMM